MTNNNNNNPVIILDIDGVLNNEKWYIKRRRSDKCREKTCMTLNYIIEHIDPMPILFLNIVCKETVAEVVISSTWRLNRSIKLLQAMLNYKGATFKIIGKTPDYDILDRGNEIDAWISENRSMKFNNYVIIDDDIGDMLIKQKDHIVKINPKYGLGVIHYDKIINILNKGSDV